MILCIKHYDWKNVTSGINKFGMCYTLCGEWRVPRYVVPYWKYALAGRSPASTCEACILLYFALQAEQSMCGDQAGEAKVVSPRKREHAEQSH